MFDSIELHPKLITAFNDLKWTTPTDVQKSSITQALAGKDLLISAETGSGKTGAYLIPALHRMMSAPTPNSGSRLLILVPTRELALQVKKDCEALCKQSNIKSVIIRGGQEFQYQASLLRRNPEVIIATPGRLTEHLSKATVDLSDVDCLVLDECDRMLDMGFRDEVLEITKHCTGKPQNLLLSATLKHKGVAQIAESILKDPEFIKIKTDALQENIQQQIIFTDGPKHKEKITDWLLKHEQFEKAIVFTKTREQANQLGNVLRYHQVKVSTLHGEVEQDIRNKIMSKFREGAINVIVATDLAARGLDVGGVDLVINFDMAQSGDEHVHRVGRTGRAGQSGLAISLISSIDYNLMSSIERYLRINFERRTVDPLKGKYNGPKNIKGNGKAAGIKKKKKSTIEKKTVKKRTNKNIGKRREPSKPINKIETGGFAPLKKKPTPAADLD